MTLLYWQYTDTCHLMTYICLAMTLYMHIPAMLWHITHTCHHMTYTPLPSYDTHTCQVMTHPPAKLWHTPLPSYDTHTCQVMTYTLLPCYDTHLPSYDTHLPSYDESIISLIQSSHTFRVDQRPARCSGAHGAGCFAWFTDICFIAS